MRYTIAQLQLTTALPGLRPGQSLHQLLMQRHRCLRALAGELTCPHRLLPACGAILFDEPLQASQSQKLAEHFDLYDDDLGAYRILSLSENTGNVPRRWQLPLAAAPAPVPLGIIDTGLNTEHPELLQATLTGRLGVQQPSSTSHNPPVQDHGTQVTSLVVGRSLGLAPEQQVFFEGVVAVDGQQRGHFNASTLLLALERLAQAGCCIVNLSLTLGRQQSINSALIRLRRELGLLSVCAWGSRDDEPATSAACLRVARGEPPLGRYPEHRSALPAASRMLPTVVLAPGGDHATACGSKGSSYDGGVSFASVTVASALARLLGHCPELMRRPAALVAALLKHACFTVDGQPALKLHRLPAAR